MGLVFTGSIYIYLDNARKKIDVDSILSKCDNLKTINGNLRYENICFYINKYLDNVNNKIKQDAKEVYKDAYTYTFLNCMYDTLYNYFLNNKIDDLNLKNTNLEYNKVARNLTECFNKIDDVLKVDSKLRFSQIDLNYFNKNITKEDNNIHKDIYKGNIKVSSDNLKEYLSVSSNDFNKYLNDTKMVRNYNLEEAGIIYKNVLNLYNKTSLFSSSRKDLKQSLKDMRNSIVDSKIIDSLSLKEEYYNFIDKDIETSNLKLNSIDTYLNLNEMIKDLTLNNSIYYKDIYLDILRKETSENKELEERLKSDLNIERTKENNIKEIESSKDIKLDK